MHGYQAVALIVIGIALPLAAGAWRGRRLALICGIAWGVTAFVVRQGDVVTTALVFLLPPLLGILLARRFYRE